MVMIFEDDDSTHDVFSHVLEQGIAGIAGGRMSTRNKLAQVSAFAKQLQHPEIIANCTVNHYWSKLAFIYDERLYLFQEAQKLVVDAYDKLLAEQGIFPETYPGIE